MTGNLPIGRRVAYFRARRGMSQQLMADLLGKSKSWLDKVERGERGLDKVSVIYAIAAVLHVDAGLLLSEHLEPAPAAAARASAVVTNRRLWGTAHREVERLIRHHIGPTALEWERPVPLRQVLTWVYAAMASECVDPSSRRRVIGTVFTLHRSQHDHPPSINNERQPDTP